MLKKIDDYRWEVPQTGGMRVPGLIYTSEALLAAMGKDESFKQVANVAHLPGIVRVSLAMPDCHWGYGFPIGGVAAFSMEEGVISPGGVGYDINCGCRLLVTKLTYETVKDRLVELMNALFRAIPSGVGSTGPIKLSVQEEKKVLQEGALWAVRNGYGSLEDLETTEDGGVMAGADPEVVSERALERGRDQLGTLGSGNHFLEIEVVEEIFDDLAAQALGLKLGQVAVMIHSGSRGLGYQICDDYLARMMKDLKNLDFSLPDRQLACAYLSSPLGREYFSAMACAANYAWANRQMLTHWTRETFEKVLHLSPRDLGMRLLYDVCHNIAKKEKFVVEGQEVELCVHRKGATRALPPGHPAVPQRYREVGQPVLIPGDMASGAYVLVGKEGALKETFGSACHGAGRVMSRSQAIKASKNRPIVREMAGRGVIVMAGGKETLHEEIPEAYKRVSEVVEVVHQAGLAGKVARLRTIGCIKG
ncbi:MAG TPA: RtcB family protein [Syntrophales bacterium]|nr:RtcB family protein [Syntrophales bacterium]HOL58322.1 RtcB family protein [Syntrophales bacterium]HPO34491.1 RtcB family protein [Syntrophales bacterium]